MAVILQISFDFPSEFLGDQLTKTAQPLAESIAKEEGFIAKIWTENVKEGRAGGIYIFEDRSLAEQYLSMHEKRMKEAGAKDIDANIFDINIPLTKITEGPLPYFDTFVE